MLKAKLAAIVGICTRHAWSVIVLSALLAAVAGVYVARHFAIDTNTAFLIEISCVRKSPRKSFD